MSVTIEIWDRESETDNTKRVSFAEADGWTFSNAGDLTLVKGGNGFTSFAAGEWIRADLGTVVVPIGKRS